MRPCFPGQTINEEKSYRRGFDQGLYCGLRLAGLSEDEIQRMVLKKLISTWRNGRTEIQDPVRFVLDKAPQLPSD